MDDCVKTLMSVQQSTSALLPLPVSTLADHITVTVAEASSSMTPSAMMWMSVRWAYAARMQPVGIHLAPSLVSVKQGTEEMA